MHVGIPHSATSSGGVYFFKDGRTVPDVLQTTFEWPDRDLTMLYSATLASSRNRGKVFMGHDASMEVSNILAITVDEIKGVSSLIKAFHMVLEAHPNSRLLIAGNGDYTRAFQEAKNI